jgi:Rrf2 family iron-sulfur cluster assembly transcriptional regulator
MLMANGGNNGRMLLSRSALGVTGLGHEVLSGLRATSSRPTCVVETDARDAARRWRAVKLSRESEYGLTGLLVLAAQPPGTVMSVAEIAEATGISFAFLAKIFNRLARGGVLRAHRGRSRGYALTAPAASISVRAVVEAIEGANLFRHCVFWSSACSESEPCVLHGLWSEIRPRVAAAMAETSLTDLANPDSVRFDLFFPDLDQTIS